MAIETEAVIQYEKQKKLSLIPHVVKQYLCPLASDSEIALFIELCKHHDINPFIKEAYLIKYDQHKPANMVVSKDFFTKRADIQPDLRKIEAGIIILNKKEDLVYRVGALILEGEKLVGGWGEIIRDGREPYRNEVSFNEYNANQSTWKTIPATMIRKVALVQVLREAYPNVFQGLYDEAEMDQAISENNKSKVEYTQDIIQPPQVPTKLKLDALKDPLDDIALEPVEIKENDDLLWGEEDKDLTYNNALTFAEELASLASNPNLLFPPLDYSRLHEVASPATPFSFIILKTDFGGFQWTHWQNQFDQDFLGVRLAEQVMLTLYIDNRKGQLLISKNTQENFGSDLEHYLKKLGYGINFWIVEKAVYEKVKTFENKK